MKPINNREKTAIEMRDKGNTFKQIGDVLGNVGPSRARQIYRKAVYKTNTEPSSFDFLSRRLKNCLINEEITDRNGAMDAVVNGLLHPRNKKPRNYGWGSHKELCKWLGLPDPTDKKRHKVCPHCGETL